MYLEGRGKLPKSEAPENDDGAEPFAYGGMVEEPIDAPDDKVEEYETSGEPHTDEPLEAPKPIGLLAQGGRVKKMAAGGKVPHPMFARAIRKSM